MAEWLSANGNYVIGALWYLHSLFMVRAMLQSRSSSCRLMTERELRAMATSTAISVYGTLIYSSILCALTFLWLKCSL